ncbi:MAG: hypothetical protein ABI442_01375 [Gemmatimonadaceae bacterium]
MTTALQGAKSPEVVERADLNGFGVEWMDASRLIVSRREMLYEIRDGEAPRMIARFPQPRWRRTAGAARLGQRALRYMFYNVLPLEQGGLFTTFGKDVALIDEHGTVKPIGGFLNPFRVLRGGCALSPDGSILFGEYRPNAERSAIVLYRYWPGSDSVEVAYTFPVGAIRHVHGIYTDPYGDGQWLLAGDIGGECRILRSTDGFRTHDVIGAGDESWRAVSMQFTPDAVYYGMDAEFTPNFIYRIDRKTGVRDVVQQVEGPMYYSTALGSEIYFAVTAELCPSQQGDFAALWHIDGATGGAKRLRTFPTDGKSVHYFMPGTLDFARGDGTRPEILFRTTSLVPDNAVFAIR